MAGIHILLYHMKLLLQFLCVVMTSQSYSQDILTFLATAELKKKLGCIDIKGNEIIPIKYDDIGFWGSNLIPVNVGAKEINYLKTGGKWGYCNSKGKLVIPIQFDKAETFREGIAAIKLNRKWGFIDTNGKTIINPKYDEVKSFSEGLCAVSINKKWGYINRKGQIIIKPEYGEASEFKNGIAIVFMGRMAKNDSEETIGKYCLINNRGERITEPMFEMIWNFKEGFAKVEIKDTADKYSTKKGFINTKGEIVVPMIYDDAYDFNEGLAAVGIKSKEDEAMLFDNNYLYGYVNEKGKEVIKVQFSLANKFIGGKAVVSRGKQRIMGFILTDTNDNSIINYEDLPQYALIDKNGSLLLDFDWGSLAPIDSNLFLAQRLKFAGDGVIDINGKTIIPFNYTNLNYIGNSLFVANDGGGNEGEVQLFTMENKLLFKTNKFGMPAPEYEFGLLHVRTNKLRKSGFVDINGNWVIKDKYDMVSDFESTNPISQ